MNLRSFFAALALCGAVILHAQTASVRIDAGRKLHRITPRFIGFNLEDLNYQTYGGLYSQMLFGESFQEHVDSAMLGLGSAARNKVFVGENDWGQLELWGFRGRGWEHDVAREVLGLPLKSQSVPLALEELHPLQRQLLRSEAAGDRALSRHWKAFESFGIRANYGFEREEPFVGKQSQRLTFVDGEGEAGVDNAGLNRRGLNLVRGLAYEGLVRVRAAKDLDVWVSLLDANGKKLATKSGRNKNLAHALKSARF